MLVPFRADSVAVSLRSNSVKCGHKGLCAMPLQGRNQVTGRRWGRPCPAHCSSPARRRTLPSTPACRYVKNNTKKINSEFDLRCSCSLPARPQPQPQPPTLHAGNACQAQASCLQSRVITAVRGWAMSACPRMSRRQVACKYTGHCGVSSAALQMLPKLACCRFGSQNAAHGRYLSCDATSTST